MTEEKRHWHTPLFWSEAYVEMGVWWSIPVCECGEALTPRRSGAVPEKSQPVPEQYAANVVIRRAQTETKGKVPVKP